MRNIYFVSNKRNIPAVRTAVPFTHYGPMGSKERARDFAYRFGDADDELRNLAFTVAAYLYLPRDVIRETWDVLDSVRARSVEAAA